MTCSPFALSTTCLVAAVMAASLCGVSVSADRVKLKTGIGESSPIHCTSALGAADRAGMLIVVALSNESFVPASMSFAAADWPVIDEMKSVVIVAASSAAHPVPVVEAGLTAARLTRFGRMRRSGSLGGHRFGGQAGLAGRIVKGVLSGD